MSQPPAFQQRFAIIFGVVFVYMIMGVFFKQQVGAWFSALWYVLGLVGAIAGVYFYLKYKNPPPKSKSTKIVKAEIVR